MGFNAIWMLPISTMGASQSPYSTSDPMAVDPAIGSWAQAETFADALRWKTVCPSAWIWCSTIWLLMAKWPGITPNGLRPPAMRTTVWPALVGRMVKPFIQGRIW